LSQEIIFTTSRNKFSVRYKYIIFPFFAGEFLGSLVKTNSGYVVGPPPQGNVPLGQTMDWAGMMAKKGKNMIFFDSLTQVIEVEGSNIIESNTVFSEVLEILKGTLEPDMTKNAQYYELSSNYSVETGERPLNRLGKIEFGGLNEKIKEIIHEPVSTYGFHFCSANSEIESTEWFDFNIQPTTRRYDKTFDVMTVYRSNDKLNVDKFASNYDGYLKKIFEAL